jgi:hypothetical protein
MIIYGIDEVIVYGAGRFAELFINEVKDSIVIRYILAMDKDAESFMGYPLFEIKEVVDIERIPIVVTTSYNWEFIDFSLRSRYLGCDVHYLKDIIES